MTNSLSDIDIVDRIEANNKEVLLALDKLSHKIDKFSDRQNAQEVKLAKLSSTVKLILPILLVFTGVMTYLLSHF